MIIGVRTNKKIHCETYVEYSFRLNNFLKNYSSIYIYIYIYIEREIEKEKEVGIS